MDRPSLKDRDSAAGQPPAGPPGPQGPAAGEGLPPPAEIGRWYVPWIPLALLGVLLLGAIFRFTNIHWDEGLSLHPDERFLTMVETSITFPETCRAFIPHLKDPAVPLVKGDLGNCLRTYLDSANSPLNPRNRGHGLWVYGTLPILLLRTITEVGGITQFVQVTEAGRALSALIDLTTVLLTFFLGQRLYGRRVGLLASLFMALSVFNIQNAHFFTVDTATALTTLLCVYLAVRIAEGDSSWGFFPLLGLAFGAAVSCKVNAATFALVIALAGLVRVWKKAQKGEEVLAAVLRTGAGLVLAALIAVAFFRLAQPDAFVGPGLLDVKLEPRYLDNLKWAQDAYSGAMDYYPGHQWASRARLWFPWKNVVLWGMGLPLGLAAWAGVALAGWQLVRKRDLRPVVPLAWTLFFFLYQGIQFVMTMRSFLPLYPLLCIFAAYLLVWLWDRARQREPRPRWRTAVAGSLLGVAILVTLLWAGAFIQIYFRPVTRATASRWVYAHVPTDRGAWLEMNDGTHVPIPIPNAFIYQPGGAYTTTAFSLPADATATGLTIAHLEDVTHSPGEEGLEAILSTDPEGRQILSRGSITGDFRNPDSKFGEWLGDFSQVTGDASPGRISFAPLRLQGGQTYYLRLQSLGGLVRTWSAAIADEQWDDAIPMGVDGKDGFATYRGIEMYPYGEDSPEKIEFMLHQLANTDYVCLTSNRLYASIPRLPMRYPATTRYYRALFDGSLGYDLVATFTSYPTLFGFYGRFGLPIPDDTAEEAFSVYDHPKVLIFQRTQRFDIDQARAILTEGVDWDAIARILPRDVPRYRDLMLTPQEWDTQRQGGTWSNLFNPNGWTNHLSLPVWLFLVELLGLAAFPLAHFLLGRLADGGYLPAKALGILLLGYLSWLLAATKALPYTRGTIALVLGILLLLGGFVGWRRWGELKALFKSRGRLILLEEGIFLLGFLVFLLIRMGNPDLWHPWFGGEKPMDLAYLNAVVRSTTFPPYDPWFSGGYLNYYYFGQVLLATPIKLTGIVPSVAYSLSIPLLYGLTCAGVFTVVYHLVSRRNGPADGWDRRAIFAGLAGAVGIALLGNLGEYMLLLHKMGEAGGLSFQSNIPGLSSLVRAVAGVPKVFRQGLPVGVGSWYWDPSRVIVQVPGGPLRGNEINEFPFFTFLYADLHPHMIALPYTLLALTQLVALVKDRERPNGSFWALFPPPWALLGLTLVLGTLRSSNFWDFPTYLLLAMGGWAVALYERRRRLDLEMAAGVVLSGLLLFFLSSFLFHPFWARYGAYYTSVTSWTGERTRVGEYLIINGLFLFVVVTYLIAESFGRGTQEAPLRLARLGVRFWDRLPTLSRRFGRWVRRPAAWYTLLWGGLALALLELYFHLPLPRNPGPSGKVLHLLLRGRGQHLVGWLVPLAVLGLVLLLRRREEGEGRFVALLVLAGLAISGGVEFLVVKNDIARQNTFFKFYLQMWVLLGVAAAATLPRLWQRLQHWAPAARNIWKAAFFTLVGMCALYPLIATPAKVRDRFPDSHMGPGLDGSAFMEQAVYYDDGRPIVLAEDVGAIRWLEENVAGSPVLLEANTWLYRWGSRISVQTGLPTVIGWDWHQKQQRAPNDGATVDRRLQDVVILYGGTDVEGTLDLLRKYQISYIVVGQLERYYYPAEGLSKFERMVGEYLELVYPATSPQGTAIYRVLPSVWGP